MIESDLQITIKGVPEESATNIGNAILEAVRAFNETDKDLDLRRMHCIIVTADFSRELEELSSSTASGNPITYTDEEYAVAVAKVMILPRDEELEILLILNAHVAAALAPENPEGYQTEGFRTVLHLLHHEMCHVHDDNKKIDAFQKIMLRHSYVGKEIFIRPLAEVCWAEYIANYLSSPTANDEFLAAMVESFADAIERTKPCIDEEIISYRYHGDLDQLMAMFQRHGAFLAKTAAAIFGYMDSLDIELSELSIKTPDNLSGSYFEPTWNGMRTALRKMRGLYPDGWTKLTIFDELAYVIEDYYARMGLILLTTQDGQAYVDVPFTSENTPRL